MTETTYWKPTWQFHRIDADRLAELVQADGFDRLAQGILTAKEEYSNYGGIQMAITIVREQQAFERAMRVVYPDMPDEVVL